MNKRLIEWIVFVPLCVLLLWPSQGRGAAIFYQYDQLNRLTSVTFGDGSRITYVYDPAGNRLSRAISAVALPVKGNVNGDDRINLADAILALKVLSGLESTGIRSDFTTSGADVGGNMKIGLEEAVYILQKVGEMR